MVSHGFLQIHMLTFPLSRVVDECDITSPSLTMQTCTSESQLAAVLIEASKQGAGAKLWVNITRPAASSRSQPALTLEAALRLLQEHYSLQAFSVLDALNATHRCKLDRDANSIYCSLLAFSCDANATLDVNTRSMPKALGPATGILSDLPEETLTMKTYPGNVAGELAISDSGSCTWLFFGWP